MALGISKPSIIQDVFNMGANLGTYYVVKKEQKVNEQEIKEIVTKKDTKQKSLNDLVKFLFKPFIIELIKKIPIPEHYKRSTVVEYLIEQAIKSIDIESPNLKQKLDKSIFLKFLKLFFDILEEMENKDIKTLHELVPKLLMKLQKIYKKLMNENIQSAKNIRKEFQAMFLQSDFPTKFVQSTSKTCNVLITYYHYISNEAERFLEGSIAIIQQGKNVNDFQWDGFFTADFGKVLELQYDLSRSLIELILFIEIWHAPNLEDILKPWREKALSYKNIDKIFFDQQIKKLDETADELHDILLETMYKNKAKIPFTLEKDPEITENEKELISNLLFM